MKLTLRQQAILDFVTGFISKSGYAPSLRDICSQFNIKSPANVAKHLNALEKKGYLRRSGRLSRAIMPTSLSSSGRTDIAASAVIRVPIAGTVRAGEPHLAVEDVSGYAFLDPAIFKCRAKDGSFLLKVRGQSMIEAGIEDGDHVLVRAQAGADSGDIVVAMIGSEATVKRFLRDDNGNIILKPENRAMEPIRAGADLSIAGKVISVIKTID